LVNLKVSIFQAILYGIIFISVELRLIHEDLYRTINLIMKEGKKVMRYIKVLFIYIIILSCLTGCVKSKFDGSRTSNDVQFIMEYSVFNDIEYHEMNLEKDDVIEVKIENESGRIDIIIADFEGNEIYRGNDALTGEFKITITESNTYKFSVSGKDAKGSVSFKVVER